MAIRFPEIPRDVIPAEIQMNYQFDHLISRVKKGSIPGKLYSPNGVAINPATNHIYVAEGNLFPDKTRISVFSDKCKFLFNYADRQFRSLWGIAIHANDMYVTDEIEHAVFHLNVETVFRMVGRLGSKGSGISQFNDPRQLSVSTKGDVYIADYCNHRIKILDCSLHPIREVNHPSMHYPTDVKLTAEEIYVLSASDSLCVHVFSHLGHKIRSLITCGEGMQVNESYFFCLDVQKGLIISDRDANKIKIFSKEGDLIHTLGGKGAKMPVFECPSGLSILLPI